jgi:hypothetical protein
MAVESAKSSSRRRKEKEATLRQAQAFFAIFFVNPVFNVVIRLCNHFAGMNM